MIRRIYFFGSLGNLKKPAAGGGQSSARRTVKVLGDLGYDIMVTNRSVPAYATNNFGGKLYKYFGFLYDPTRWFFRLMKGQRGESVAFVIGYSGPMFPYFFLYVKIAKLLGYKTVFYLKGGFTEKRFNSFPKWQQHSYRKGLQYVDLALYEGEEGVKVSEKVLPSIKAVWIPNYVANGFAPSQYIDKPKETINLLYFGRLHPHKNVIMIVDVFDKICETLPNVTLTIVGTGLESYKKLLSSRIDSSPNKAKINRIGHSDQNRIKELMTYHHFFIFPSEEANEGHSNSLNEAMSYGLIPIVSANNFLPSIVGNSDLVSKEINYDAYASIISEIMCNGKYNDISKEVYDRVKYNFTQNIVETKLKGLIDGL